MVTVRIQALKLSVLSHNHAGPTNSPEILDQDLIAAAIILPVLRDHLQIFEAGLRVADQLRRTNRDLPTIKNYELSNALIQMDIVEPTTTKISLTRTAAGAMLIIIRHKKFKKKQLLDRFKFSIYIREPTYFALTIVF
jgi:hypothetical protein